MHNNNTTNKTVGKIYVKYIHVKTGQLFNLCNSYCNNKITEAGINKYFKGHFV